MYNLSDNALTFIRNGHPQKLRIVIQPQGSVSEIIIDETQVKSCSISRSCCSSDKIEIGSVSSAQLSLTIVNGTGETGSVDFSNTNLEGAIIKVYCRVPYAVSGSTYSYETVDMGVFTVDEQRRKNKYTGSLTAEINITAFDNVMRLDREIADGFAPGSSLRALANACCSACGLSLASATDTLIGNMYSSFTLPSSFNTENSKPTYREIIGCIAELCCCDCYADETSGYITFRKVQPNVNEDPFVFAESDRYSSDTKEDDTSVTGIFVKDLNGGTKTIGTTAYALQCEGNILLVNANQFANQTMPLITYRPFTANILSFPHLRPLDKVVYRVTKEAPEENIDIASVITSVTWSFNKGTTIGAAGMSQVRNGFAKGRVFTARQQQILDTMAQQQSQQLSDFEIATLNLNDRLQYSMGMFDTYKIEENGSKTHYYHNEKNLADSTYVVKFAAGGTVWTSGEGCWKGTTTVVDGVVVVTSDGETVWQYGFTSGGEAVLANIAAKKISAELLTIGTPAKVKNLIVDSDFYKDNETWGYQDNVNFGFSLDSSTNTFVAIFLDSAGAQGSYSLKSLNKIKLEFGKTYSFGCTFKPLFLYDETEVAIHLLEYSWDGTYIRTVELSSSVYYDADPNPKRINGSIVGNDNNFEFAIVVTHKSGKDNGCYITRPMLYEGTFTGGSPNINFPYDSFTDAANGYVSITPEGVDVYKGAIKVYNEDGDLVLLVNDDGEIVAHKLLVNDGTVTLKSFNGRDSLYFGDDNKLYYGGTNPVLTVAQVPNSSTSNGNTTILPGTIRLYPKNSIGASVSWFSLDEDSKSITKKNSSGEISFNMDNYGNVELHGNINGFDGSMNWLNINKDTRTIQVLNRDGNVSFLLDNNGTLRLRDTVIEHVTTSSDVDKKTNIKPAGSVLSQVLSAGIYNYDYKSEVDGKKSGEPQYYGLVIGKGYNTPKEVIAKDGKGVDLYSMISLAWKAIQEQQEQIDELKQRIDKPENKGG